MAVNRARIVDDNFRSIVGALTAAPQRHDLDSPVRPGTGLTARRAIELFEVQLVSRHLDIAARELRARGEGFYTIGSSGHEGAVAVADATRTSDPAFLHYRSGGFFLRRAYQAGGQTPILDVLLGMCASADDPISGGRHKVWGSLSLQVPPQTSTIASHLPKAVGAAVTLDRMKRLELDAPVPDDAIVVCTFGDASSNHSTAAGAVNAACWTSYQRVPAPVLFVCEDNGIGISVRTPTNWVAANYGNRPAMTYFYADGLDLPHAWDAAQAAAAHVRDTRQPAFLHVRTVRLLGHAGSDVEQAYRSMAEIKQTEAQDPVLATARLLVEQGWLSPSETVALYEETRARVMSLADEAARRPRLSSPEAIVAPLAPLDADAVAQRANKPTDGDARSAFWKGKLPEADPTPKHLAVQLNRALGDGLVRYPGMLIFGEDVAKKGGVYHVTHDLARRAGVGRVFNTLLDETSILGMAIGAGQLGCLPVPEIQYLAYLHNAEDQLRGEAASLQFFSNGQYRNPMVVRIASYAYQKGFGGHFHNDNAIGVLRDIPGLVIASPARGDDAVGMMRSCLAHAEQNGAVVAFLEPIALYMTRDLHDDGDGLWATTYPAPGETVPIGTAREYGDGDDLTLISWANGLWMSLRVAKRLEKELGVSVRVVDLRWLSPLPEEQLLAAAQATGRVLIVDETRKTGGMSEAIITSLVDQGFDGEMSRVTAWDTFIPLGDAANLVLVQEEDIEREAKRMLGVECVH